MRRWLRPGFVVGLLVGVLAVEVGLRVLEVRTGDLAGATGTVADHAGTLAHDGNDFDVVAVGSSSAGSALLMDDLERANVACDGYVAWLPGTSMAELSAFTAEVVLPAQAPDQLLVGVTMREFAPSAAAATERDGRRWAPHRPPGDELGVIRARATLQDPERLGRAVFGTPEEPISADGNQIGMRDRVIADESAEHRQQEAVAMSDYRHHPAAFRELADLVGHALDSGSSPVVVNLPVTDEFVALAPRGTDDYTRYVAALQEVTETAGVPLVDLGDMPLDTAADFADVNHLNDSGATKLTSRLARELEHCER